MGLELKQSEAAVASGQTPFGAVVVILSIDGRINEPVKWNAPGFYRAVTDDSGNEEKCPDVLYELAERSNSRA